MRWKDREEESRKGWICLECSLGRNQPKYFNIIPKQTNVNVPPPTKIHQSAFVLLSMNWIVSLESPNVFAAFNNLFFVPFITSLCVVKFPNTA